MPGRTPMRWTERQRAMLGAMGITLSGPDLGVAAEREPTEMAAAEGGLTAAAPPGSSMPPAAIATSPVAPTVVDDPEIASLNWEPLRARVAACRACRLCESRTQTVFGVGNQQAQCMIVGEAPGENEDRLGEPFVGAAGQLLDRMLHAIGLTRAVAAPQQQVYIANTLKCRPPRNRNPEPDELARCSVYLHRQIALVQPRLLLAMGRFAVQSLLDSSEPIGR